MSSPRRLATFLVAAAALSLAGCGSAYNGPTVSRVGVTGAYTDPDGQTFSGGVSADLAYPLPAARRTTPSPK